MPESVLSLYIQHKYERKRPSFVDILDVLHSVAARYSRVIVVVDALDECSVSDGGRNMFLSAIFKLQASAGVNLFATSRINDDIANLFERAVTLHIRATNDDVERYLERQMSLLRSDVLDDALRGLIRREVIKAAKGMYANLSTKIPYVSILTFILGFSLHSYT